MARQQKPAIVETPAAEEPAKTLFDRVAAHLDKLDWKYSAFADKGYFSTNCRLEEGSVRIIIDVVATEDVQRVSVYSSYPIYAPKYRRAALAECLTRINYRTIVGNFEMDLTDGEIRMRTTTEASGDIGDKMLERVISLNMGTAGRFFAPLLAVAFGNAGPETVFDLAERRDGATLQ